jgi:hypothetical protein
MAERQSMHNEPTTTAQMLIQNLGTKLHHSTTLTPHLSATKLNGTVTMKSVVRMY